MRRFSAAVLALLWVLLLCVPVSAADTSTADEAHPLDDLATYYDFEHRPLEDIMEQFRTEYGLDENNFAMGYYATGTGDAYGFQVDSYRDAGYTYMLPLNVVFYDLDALGTFDADANYVGTYYLPYLYEYTINGSDTAMAKTMWSYLGEYREYRQILTQFSDQVYTEEYYSENVFNIRYMMNVLWHIYKNATDYTDLLGFMGEAYQGDAFDLHLEDIYNVAHKYSGEDGIYNDVGIIYTREPFLLAAFSQNVGHAEEMLGALSELMAEYTEYLTDRKAQGLPAYTATETEAPAEETVAMAVTPAPAKEQEEEKEDGPVPVWVLILVIILAVILVIAAYMKGLVKGASMERQRIRQAARKKKQQQ